MKLPTNSEWKNVLKLKVLSSSLSTLTTEIVGKCVMSLGPVSQHHCLWKCACICLSLGELDSQTWGDWAKSYISCLMVHILLHIFFLGSSYLAMYVTSFFHRLQQTFLLAYLALIVWCEIDWVFSSWFCAKALRKDGCFHFCFKFKNSCHAVKMIN